MLRHRIVAEKKFDLVDYLCVLILDIRNLNQKTRLLTRRTRIINVYNQIIDRGYIYLGVYTKKRRAIKDIN